MQRRHGVSPQEVNEALTDREAIRFDPDYASRSGHSTRTIGFSPTAGRLLTVITLRTTNGYFGVNSWPANDTDRRHYRGDFHDEH